jgi:hypothetical protein
VILVVVDLKHITLKNKYVAMVDVESCTNEVHVVVENKATIQRNPYAVVAKLHRET